MPKRGRKPEPKVLHVMRGTARGDRHPGDDPDPGNDIGEAPSHLGKHGTWFWFWGRDQWARIGMAGDPVSLEGMADLYERWRNAKARVPDGGFFICERTGNPKRHPAATEALQCFKDLRIQMEGNALNMAGWSRQRGKGGDVADDAKEMFGG